MTTPPLSPAAQAVLNAHFKLNDRCNPTISQEIAAALRALADEVAHVRQGDANYMPKNMQTLAIRNKILAIANELHIQP
jgi:hypothetical protein